MSSQNDPKYNMRIFERDDYNINFDANNLNKTKNINSNIYRFKLTDSIIKEVHNFAKIHEFDDRKDFKEAWKIWVIEQNTIISQETQRLIELGYEGDVVDKMFKSARYYFRKKSTEKKEPKERRAYQSVSKQLLDAIDLHLKNVINNADFKPSNGFDMFCKENISLLKEEVTQL
jgi:hypothetical protein